MVARDWRVEEKADYKELWGTFEGGDDTALCLDCKGGCQNLQKVNFTVYKLCIKIHNCI